MVPAQQELLGSQNNPFSPCPGEFFSVAQPQHDWHLEFSQVPFPKLLYSTLRKEVKETEGGMVIVQITNYFYTN